MKSPPVQYSSDDEARERLQAFIQNRPTSFDLAETGPVDSQPRNQDQ